MQCYSSIMHTMNYGHYVHIMEVQHDFTILAIAITLLSYRINYILILAR